MKKSVFKRRVFITGFILSVVLFFFVIKLVSLHFSDKIVIPEAEPIDDGRGYIYDREGYLLALSIQLNSFYVNPQELSELTTVAAKLSPIVNIPQNDLISKFTVDRKFVWLIRQCDDQLSEKIKSLNIKGIYYTKEYKRVYPYSNLAANVIGFVGLDNNGLDGVEYRYNNILSGRDEVVKDEIFREVYRKKNLTLTIDRYIQYIAEDELSKAMALHRAAQGSVVILDTASGKILAMAKYPSYNLNYFNKYNQVTRSNFGIVDAFEPGSTFKIIALASLLENRPDALKREYFCDGYLEVSGVRINCLHRHGKITMDRIISESCNAGMMQSVGTLERKEFYDTIRKFGFGTQTGIELPGEAEGILRPVPKWSGLSKYSMSLGHEISVTTIQLTAAFNAIANNGVYLIPSLIERIEKPDGTIVHSFNPRSKGRIMKQENVSTIINMMRDVVAKGTGKKADSVYYQIAGKTGTSQKFSRAEGTYSDRNVSSFAGIAPYKKPIISMAVVIDDPGDKVSGGASAAPLFMRIADRVLPYLGAGGKDVSSLKMKKSVDKKIIYDTVPDLRGMNINEVADVLRILSEKHDVKYYLKGAGKVYAQKPMPGSTIQQGDNIILHLR
ncbi:MAG: penicillin-binding transpeptidase domain-containing protein [Leptospirales bacterium]|nr:penicillin-binding transpeptidase domain-containing protein [Leptospirales bacterium]